MAIQKHISVVMYVLENKAVKESVKDKITFSYPQSGDSQTVRRHFVH